MLGLAAVAAKEGISFVVVGDFALLSDMKAANAVFDDIASLKQNAVIGSKEDYDFFVTTGDNIYPAEFRTV